MSQNNKISYIDYGNPVDISQAKSGYINTLDGMWCQVLERACVEVTKDDVIVKIQDENLYISFKDLLRRIENLEGKR